MLEVVSQASSFFSYKGSLNKRFLELEINLIQYLRSFFESLEIELAKEVHLGLIHHIFDQMKLNRIY